MHEIRPWATNKSWILFLPRPPTLQLTLKLRNLRLHLRHQHGTMGKMYRKPRWLRAPPPLLLPQQARQLDHQLRLRLQPRRCPQQSAEWD
eukprot:gene11275-8011_t